MSPKVELIDLAQRLKKLLGSLVLVVLTVLQFSAQTVQVFCTIWITCFVAWRKGIERLTERISKTSPIPDLL